MKDTGRAKPMSVKKCKYLCSSVLRRFAGCAAVIAGVLLLGGFAHSQQASNLTVAAASDLQYVMKELTAEFEHREGLKVAVVYGSSGNLSVQVQNGAPYDVFLSADMDYPRKLVSAHLADANSLYRYAIGRLALWSPNRTTADVSKGMPVLLDSAVARIAIANPRHAPYGRAAVAALKHARVYDKVQSRLVMGENVSQAAQFAESGNVQVGFVPLAFVFSPTFGQKGTYFEIPTDWYPSLDQGAVLLNKASHRAAGERFLAFLKGSEGVRLLKKYGYITPKSLLGDRP
jgi:molybdate transport system substrate-binding protein